MSQRMRGTCGKASEQAFLLPATSSLSLRELPELRGHRVYLGSEFCDRLLPAKDEFIGTLRLAAELDIRVTLLTPLFSEKGINLFKSFIREIAERGEFGFEVVFNDWGVIGILEEFPLFKRVMGRLLSSYHTDVDGFPPAFLDFLKEKRVLAAELNPAPQCLAAREHLAAWDIKAHVYYPFMCLTNTRFCTSVMTSGRSYRDAIGFCAKECAKTWATVNYAHLENTILAKGNAWFSKMETALGSLPLKPDRLVFDDLYFEGRLPSPSSDVFKRLGHFWGAFKRSVRLRRSND